MDIDPATGAVDVPETLQVSGVRPADTVLSHNGLTLYVAGSDGRIRVYNAETGELVRSWLVGKQLGGIDLSPDGKFLMATDRAPISDGWPYGGAVVVSHRVETATGKVTTFPLTVEAGSYAFFDVAIMSDQTVLISQSTRPGWSKGGMPLRLLDPQTGTYTSLREVRQDTILSDTPSGARALFMEANGQADDFGVYGRPGGVIAYGGANGNGINRGVQAYNVAANLIAQHAEDHLHIYDGALNYMLDVGAKFPGWQIYGNLAALAFDPAGKFLFVLDVGANSIVQLSTSTWTIIQSIPVGLDISSWQRGIDGYQTRGGYGSNLLVGADLRFFTIITDQGLYRIDNPLIADALAGTAGADTIKGTSADEVLIGYAGNDALNGGGGADTMRGSFGNDTYYVNVAADKVIETSASHGTDKVISSVSYTLGAFVEQLTLTGTGRIHGTGNAHNNIINGNAGANVLKGGGGADTLIGGGGNDKLYGGLGNDTLKGGTGADGFYFDTLPGSKNVDTIQDFAAVDDTIFLDRDVFAAVADGALRSAAFRLGSKAADSSDRIVYDQAAGNIYYDPDGTGAAPQVLFATVVAGTSLTNADFVGFI